MAQNSHRHRLGRLPGIPTLALTLQLVDTGWTAGSTPRCLPDSVELLMVLAGVVTSGSS